MSIVAKFQLTEKRKIIASDKAPTYVFEATGDGDVLLGRIKLRVANPAAQRLLRESDEFNVEITPLKK